MTRIVFRQNDVTYVGTDQADQIFGLGGHNIFYGGDGADLIVGGKGRNVIFGGEGMDRIDGRAGFDSLLGGRGDDVLLGGDGADQLFGAISIGEEGVVGSGGGHDILRGGNGNDVIDGLDDRLFGDAGQDQFSSFAGFGSTQDTHTDMTGGAGSDRFFLNANTNGFKDIVEVMDFKRGDEGLRIDGSEGGLVTISVVFDGATGKPIIDQDFSDPSVFNPHRVGHDIVFTTNADLDQVIIHNADWLTI